MAETSTHPRPKRSRAPRRRRRTILALALGALYGGTLQATTGGASSPPEPAASQRIEPVTVSAPSAPALEQEEAAVGGFSRPLRETPQSISVLGADLLAATGTRTLSAMARLEAGLADSYNAVGYIESLNVRGFDLRSIGNYRRNGLAWWQTAPVAAESIERFEILKGVSGLQAGVSAPGGLVNIVSKRPLPTDATDVLAEFTDRGGRRLHLDLSRTFATGHGLRMNVAAEALRPPIEAARGERALVHLASSARTAGGLMVEFEAEWSQQRQPSVPGFGLLDRDGDGVGETLPALGHARRPQAGFLSSRSNLNGQPWSLPMRYDNAHAGIDLRQSLGGGWQARAAVRTWRSRLDDRIAFPDGCSGSDVYVYPGWCGDGSVDLYDYRSENERRRMMNALAEISGRFDLAGVATRMTFGFDHHATRARHAAFQTYNYIATINGFSPALVAPDPSPSGRNTDSDERSLAATLRGETSWGDGTTFFWGVNSTWLVRESVRTDGSRRTRLEQRLTTPWVGLTQDLSTLAPGLNVYANLGQGIEAEVVPNRPSIYINAGSVLPAARSRQWEVGAKWRLAPRLDATVALFDIRRPSAEDAQADGGRLLRLAAARTAHHRGAEAMLTGRLDARTSVHLSAAWLDARIRASLDPALIGQRPVNVPRTKLALFLHHQPAAWPDLTLDALLSHEAGKRVDAPSPLALPALSRLDLGVTHSWRHGLGNTRVRLAVGNALNRAGWREAPTAPWGGVYLFPLEARVVRLTLTHAF